VAGTAALVVGLVVAIADGDTLTVLNEDFQQVKVRLAEIDAARRSVSPSVLVPGSHSASFATRSVRRCGSSTWTGTSASLAASHAPA